MPAEPLRVFLVDDHALLRNVMALALERMENVTVVGQASNGRDAVDAVYTDPPDLILMASSCRYWTVSKRRAAFGATAPTLASSS